MPRKASVTCLECCSSHYCSIQHRDADRARHAFSCTRMIDDTLNGEECPICLERPDLVNGPPTVRFQCQHSVCGMCYRGMLEQSTKTDPLRVGMIRETETCPLCRKVIGFKPIRGQEQRDQIMGIFLPVCRALCAANGVSPEQRESIRCIVQDFIKFILYHSEECIQPAADIPLHVINDLMWLVSIHPQDMFRQSDLKAHWPRLIRNLGGEPIHAQRAAVRWCSIAGSMCGETEHVKQSAKAWFRIWLATLWMRTSAVLYYEQRPGNSMVVRDNFGFGVSSAGVINTVYREAQVPDDFIFQRAYNLCLVDERVCQSDQPLSDLELPWGVPVTIEFITGCHDGDTTFRVSFEFGPGSENDERLPFADVSVRGHLATDGAEPCDATKRYIGGLAEMFRTVGRRDLHGCQRRIYTCPVLANARWAQGGRRCNAQWIAQPPKRETRVVAFKIWPGDKEPDWPESNCIRLVYVPNSPYRTTQHFKDAMAYHTAMLSMHICPVKDLANNGSVYEKLGALMQTAIEAGASDVPVAEPDVFRIIRTWQHAADQYLEENPERHARISVVCGEEILWVQPVLLS